MNGTWQVHRAKARFSEFLEASLSEGPQVVTKRGVAAAVLVPIEQWRQMERSAKPSLKDLLHAPGPRSETVAPDRADRRRRIVPASE